MIDKQARQELAEQLRHFAAGLITNDQFADRLRVKTDDRAIEEIRLEIWGLYDDLHEHKLTGPYSLSPDARELVSRCILFLKTDEPWRWPKRALVFWAGILSFPLTFFLLDLHYLWAVLLMPLYLLFAFAYRRWYARRGDSAVWPFASRAAYDRTRASHVYLCGTAA